MRKFTFQNYVKHCIRGFGHRPITEKYTAAMFQPNGYGILLQDYANRMKKLLYRTAYGRWNGG